MAPLALVRASHPAPALVVTAVVTALTAAAGGDSAACLRVALVVLLGQLSIGWCNDAVDAAADAAAKRHDKPVVRGEVDVRVLSRAAGATLLIAVVLSPVLLGMLGGVAHVVAVVAAWAYNLRLKDTAWSALPYAVAFGLVPVVAAGAGAGVAPQPWAVLAGATLGVGAHLANTARDVSGDRAVGRGGLAVRLGERWARLAAVVSFWLGTVVVLAVVAPPILAVVLALAQLATLVTAACLASGRYLFPVVLTVVAMDAAVLAVADVPWLAAP
jgi:4-hydroxybenzoate polyprenyltransferase